MEPHNYAREAFDFIDGLDRLSSTDAVVGSTRHMLARYGFHTLLFTGLPNPRQRFDGVVLGVRRPSEWSRIYNEGRYVQVDPVIRHLRRAVVPFEWTDARFDPESEPRAAELMRLRSDFGFGRALVVPVSGPAGNTGGVSISGLKPELTAQNQMTINLIALYAFERAAFLREVPPKPLISDREREVLTWTAAGKSAWEIGEILNVAKRTVDEHARNAARKLGAATRTQAVALAIRDRFISV